MFERSPEVWQKYIEVVSADEHLVRFYPDLVRTGAIEAQHLNKLIELVSAGLIPANSTNVLSYGGVTSELAPEVISDFCVKLSVLGDEAAWPALNIMFMYCFGNMDRLDTIRSSVKSLVLAVPLHKKHSAAYTDLHAWCALVEALLNTRDEELVVDVSRQLIASCRIGFNHNDLWSYIKPLLMKLVKQYGGLLWPVFGEAISNAKGMQLYWLQKLLDRENSVSSQLPSILSAFPSGKVISWCYNYPESGPGFVAACINIFEVRDSVQFPSELFVMLLENFGGDQRVASALNANMASRGWSGSLVPYLEADKLAITPLLKHKNGYVRKWVKEHIDSINYQIARESSMDAERDLGIF